MKDRNYTNPNGLQQQQQQQQQLDNNQSHVGQTPQNHTYYFPIFSKFSGFVDKTYSKLNSE